MPVALVVWRERRVGRHSFQQARTTQLREIPVKLGETSRTAAATNTNRLTERQVGTIRTRFVPIDPGWNQEESEAAEMVDETLASLALFWLAKVGS